MNFELSEEQQQVKNSVREFAESEIRPHVMEWDESQHFSDDLRLKLAELGLMGVIFPEAYGGAGMGYVEYATIIEELARVDGSVGLSVAAHNSLCSNHIYTFGTEEQKQKYLVPLAQGEAFGAWGLTEPQAGSDAQNSRTRAILSPDGRSWILNGQKMWITNGGFADVYIVFAKVDGEKFSCFIVERDFPGFSAGAEEKKMGLKGSSTTAIFFENCQVPRENLLHDIGRGHIVAFNILNSGRFSLGAYCTGGSKGTLEISSKYAKERVAFGKPIAEFGLIRGKLAEMAIRIFAVESMIYRSAGLMDRAIAAAGAARARKEIRSAPPSSAVAITALPRPPVKTVE